MLKTAWRSCSFYLKGYFISFGVFGNIGHRFLKNPVNIDLKQERQATVNAFQLAGYPT